MCPRVARNRSSAGSICCFALAKRFGIIGPSAAGKSTLARLLVGVWLPTAGKVRLDGIDISSWSRADLGPHIGYVPQVVELLAGTVRENIARYEQASDEQIIAAAQAANAHELVIRLPKGYDTEIETADLCSRVDKSSGSLSPEQCLATQNILYSMNPTPILIPKVTMRY